MLEMIRDWIGESTEKEVCPECKEHPDCFAWVDGRCTALTRTDGRCMGRGRMDRSCGFYRAREGVREEGRQNYKRLKAVGRWDLIWKYHASGKLICRWTGHWGKARGSAACAEGKHGEK